MNLLHSGKLGGFTQENNTIDSENFILAEERFKRFLPVSSGDHILIDQPQFLKFNISSEKKKKKMP